LVGIENVPQAVAQEVDAEGGMVLKRLGRMCRVRIRRLVNPMARAATTNSRAFS
jgi:hypothetical protein